MNRCLTAVVVLLLAFASVRTFAQDVFRLTNLDAVERASPNQMQSTRVRYDATTVHSIVEAYPVVCAIDLPFATGNETVVLTQSGLLAPSAAIVRGTDNGDEATDYMNRIRCYRGRSSDGRAVLVTFTANTLYCTVSGTSTMHVLTQNGGGHSYSLVPSLPPSSPFICGTSDSDIDDRLRETMHNTGKQSQLQNTNVLTISVAVEIDNVLSARYSDTTQAIAYSLSVLEASSVVMERDLNAKYAITYVRVWRTRPPYTVSTPSPNTMNADIKRFAAWWSDTMKGKVEYDAVHWLSYSNQNAGIASRIGGICSDSGTYALTFLKLDLTQGNSRSGDVQVLSHEFGHVFGSPHTHSCMWQGGPIDNCAGGVENGPCAYTRSQTEMGTIMSYCLMRGNAYPFSLSFHPQCASLIRKHLNRVPCVGNQPAARNARIFGYVRNKDGKPMRDIQMTLRPMNELYWEGTPALLGDSVYTTKADGFYEFRNLASGLYRVQLSDGYAVLPSSPGETEQSVTMRAMCMVNDTSVQKDWIIGKLSPVLILTGDTTRISSATIFVSILPIDTLPVQVFGSGNATVFATNNKVITYLQSGKYLIYPWSSNNTQMFTPAYRIVTVSESQTQSVVSFNPTGMARSTFLGITGERIAPFSTTIRPLVNEPVALANTSVGTPDSTVRSDSNGVIVTYSGTSVPQRFARFASMDTSRFITESTPWSPWNMTTSAISLLYRRPRTAPFIHRYAFSQDSVAFNDIRTTGVLLPLADSTVRMQVQLPFPFRYGDSTYTTADVWQLGALSVGPVVRTASVQSQPTLYYGYPAGGVMQVHSQNFTLSSAADTTRSLRIWRHTGGTAPNRIFTVQWHYLRRIPSTNDSISIISQIRLYEQTSIIEFVYGDCAIRQQTQPLGTVGYVGIQGADAFDVHSRTSNGGWNDNYRGIRVGSTIPTMPFQTGQIPTRGLLFRWVDTTNLINSIDDDAAQHPQIRLSPNPASDVLTLTRDGSNPCTIQIHDAFGRTVHNEHNIIAGVHTVPLQGLAAGVYYCRISSTSGGAITRAFVVVR